MGQLWPLLVGGAVGGGIAAATAKKPKPVTLPAVQQVDVLKTTELTTVAEQAGEAEAKRARRRRGRAETILAGPLEPKTTKKTLLG